MHVARFHKMSAFFATNSTQLNPRPSRVEFVVKKLYWYRFFSGENVVVQLAEALRYKPES